MIRKRWQFTPRVDGRIGVTLDNNVWDFLFSKNLDLDSELPRDHFCISITREVEIETLAIPTTASKTALREYIAHTIESCDIRTTYVFGFANEGPGPERLGGFDQGVWQSETEAEFYDAIRKQYLASEKEQGSQLFKNEGDAAVAAQSFFSIVLTCESPTKTGPLRFASESGGKVLYLKNFDPATITLRDFVEDCHKLP